MRVTVQGHLIIITLSRERLICREIGFGMLEGRMINIKRIKELVIMRVIKWIKMFIRKIISPSSSVYYLIKSSIRISNLSTKTITKINRYKPNYKKSKEN